jgi:hypothetical protein
MWRTTTRDVLRPSSLPRFRLVSFRSWAVKAILDAPLRCLIILVSAEAKPSTEAISPAARKVLWRVLLAIVMSVLSAFLMVLARRQRPMQAGMGWDVPARVINSLINGPGFFLGAFMPAMPDILNRTLSYDANRLLGIAFFWFSMGLSIDRRRNKQAIDLRQPISAGVMFTFLALVCGLLGFGGIAEFRHRVPWEFIAEYPLRTWDTMNLGFEVWTLLFFVYFARRAFIATRRSLTKTA